MGSGHHSNCPHILSQLNSPTSQPGMGTGSRSWCEEGNGYGGDRQERRGWTERGKVERIEEWEGGECERKGVWWGRGKIEWWRKLEAGSEGERKLGIEESTRRRKNEEQVKGRKRMREGEREGTLYVCIGFSPRR